MRVSTEAFQQTMMGMMTGTPAATVVTLNQLTWVGYAAILSPGQTVWLELDLTPGAYLAVSDVLDPETQMPAFMLGMTESFAVAGEGAIPEASPAATPAASQRRPHRP